MIVYVDSSVVARALLHDEPGHAAARELLGSSEHLAVTGSWTLIEVTGALVRAARTGRLPRLDEHLRLLDGLLGPHGRVISVDAPQAAVETTALDLVRRHGLRAMDAWHLAVAQLALPELSEPGDPVGFASRDAEQATVADALGLTPV